MCGIVGYVGSDRSAQEVLIDGLRRLEYRGYDSAGVAIFDGKQLAVRRAVGKLVNLDTALREEPLAGSVGIGHTRWATHGKPSEANAHPHRAGSVAVVHNGIVENYQALRDALKAEGREILSDTDTEVIAHLIDQRVEAGSDLLTAVREATAKLVGSYALGVVSTADPDSVVVAKNGGSPIILGVGQGESFLASDIPAILPYTREMIFLEDAEFAVLSREGVQVVDAQGHLVEREPKRIAWDPVSAEKGGFDHFMQKEIFEQPRAIRDTIGTRVGDDLEIDLDGIDLSPDKVKKIERVVLVACGTAYYASLIGKYLIEQIAGIPAEVDLASEYRYRRPIIDQNCLMVPVSQSGETADTLAALREGKERGAWVLSVCNTRESTIARESHDVLYTRAGPEIGVASTKCFTTQFVALYLLALKLGISRKTLSGEKLEAAIDELRRLPRIVEETLQLDDQIKAVAQRYFRATNFLFLGRGVMYPVALEGALKLKEISYIHAEGYAAGEMKHGPIALIDENMPVVVMANQGSVYEKVMSNLDQVRARDGQVIAIASVGDDAIDAKADAVIRIPELGDYLTALIATIPVQLLAYHIATLKGTDVDQPRNLAKSVTVE
ncbi:MAG: glutamine--fructose-6-phosphate transaminase (isomerizing) [Deltaproteobacteria bacterium]|nr:glutamine--fructose-6-phosphate transaminase (isomerizing) [Deltaproteobacteria bacterium]MBW2396544.1 glutamine--fructose-6-phosphate transaminase (isomerizing) [Deltaproteobacteria bacterium]